MLEYWNIARKDEKIILCVLGMDEAPAFIYQGNEKLSPIRIKQRKEIRMYLQRLVIGVVSATLVAGSTVASAQSDAAKKPLGKMTCEDFLVLDVEATETVGTR